MAIALCLWPAAAGAQVADVPQVDIPDVIRTLFKKPPAPASSNQSPGETTASLLPTVSSNPAIGVGFGAVVSMAARRSGVDGPLSTSQASFTVTTKKQVIGAVRNNLYTPSGAWSLVGDLRLAKFFQSSPVLGSNPLPDADTFDVDYNWIRLHETAYHRVSGKFHLGLGYHLDSFIDIEPVEGEVVPDEFAGEEARTTVASGLSGNALFDSRDNPLNASRGFYGRGSYQYFPEWLGSDSDWQMLQLEGRAYVRLPSARRQVLAAWTQTWLTLDGDPPYFNLPSVGWDTYGRSARGYAAGSLRGRDWGYVEGEYRVDLMRNGFLGAVAFVNASTLSDRGGDYGEWAVGRGAGFRFKLNKKYGTNIAVDFAWGRNGSSGVWFGLNEVF